MDKIDELLTRGVDTIYPSKKALEKVLRQGKKLRVYQGFDPTGPQLHIGHLVGLLKLNQFQKLNHHVIFLIGDFTGMIGDPSGKTSTRKPLSQEVIRKNALHYKEQVSGILKFSGKNPVEIKYNSHWLSKISAIDFLKLARFVSYQQIIKRDMFKQRLKEGKDLFVNEFIYPLLQGYDSVVMDIDVEIGGTDQLFNMMTGRSLMRKMKKREKFVITTPLLADSLGQKIGKTEGNVIGLTAKPRDLYGMIMTLPDDVIEKCFEYITDLPIEEVVTIKKNLKKDKDPMRYKKLLAFTLVRMLNNEKNAEQAQEYFEKTFQKKTLPQKVPSIRLDRKKEISILDLLTEKKIIPSRSQAKRLIKQKAIDLNGKTVKDPFYKVSRKDSMILKVGKHRFYRISLDH